MKSVSCKILLAAFVLFSVSHGSLAYAQPPKTQVIVLENPNRTSAAIRFQKAITALADSSRSSIVAEGAPVTFDETKLQGAVYADASLVKKMLLLADAADYNMKNTRGVFLLTKRYSDPDDLPCVTLGECRTSMKTVSALLARLLPPPQAGTGDPVGRVVGDFFRSLTPEQREAMEKGPLPSSQFTPVQRDKAGAMLATTYLFPLVSSAEITLRALSEQPDIMLRKYNANGTAFLVWNDKNRPTVMYGLLNGITERGHRTAPVPGKILPDLSSTTLGREFAKLNQRAGKEASASTAVYEAGEDFAEKPLTVAGLERLDTERAAAALVGVYDLRLRTLSSARTVARRPALASVNLVNVGDAVATALPAPLSRLLTGKTEDKFVPAEQREALQGSPPGIVNQQTVMLYADAAVQRLRQGHEREFDAAGSKGIPVADMDATDRRALTVATISRFLEEAASLLNSRPPLYIERFGQLAVSGSRYTDPADKKPKIKMNLLVSDGGQGGYRIVAGYSNVPDDGAQ